MTQQVGHEYLCHEIRGEDIKRDDPGVEVEKGLYLNKDDLVVWGCVSSRFARGAQPCRQKGFGSAHIRS